MLSDAVQLERHSDETLCAHLLRAGLVDAEPLARARRLVGAGGDRLPALLTKLGLIAESDLARAMAQAFGLATIAADEFPAEPAPAGAPSPRFLKDARMLPVAERDEALVVAVADPTDDYALQALQALAGRPLDVRVAVPAELEAAIARLHGGGPDPAPHAGVNDDDAGEDVSRLKDMASEAPVVRLVNQMIAAAVEQRATDIHVEPFDKRLAVRFRVDGLLREVDSPSAALRAAIVSRIKIMARLDIAEQRLPQDGRIRTVVRGREIDLRVSTVPTVHGESVVLRLLDRRAVSLDFAALGFDGDVLARWEGALARPHGIVLVTGPTGSGKTTTLYASLARLNTAERKIVTVEDPVEYQLDGINQIPVRPQIGLTFAQSLRAILRQDPDVLMVGEIRDIETAEIAVQAALTGHLVLSTLHTNDAPGAVLRLLDMGVADYLLAATVNAILAQRLVRTLCAACAAPTPTPPEVAAAAARVLGRDPCESRCRAPRGCPACGHTGYRGRTALAELIVVDPATRGAIARARDAAALHAVAAERGMRTLLQDGLAKVLAGVTTFDEVARVTHDAA